MQDLEIKVGMPVKLVNGAYKGETAIISEIPQKPTAKYTMQLTDSGKTVKFPRDYFKINDPEGDTNGDRSGETEAENDGKNEAGDPEGDSDGDSDNFYTRCGWKGAKYDEVKDLPTKEIAKRIKKEIQQRFPDIKISVRTKHFAGGCEINATIKELPFNPIHPEWNPNNFDKYDNPKYTEQAKNMLDEIRAIGRQYKRSDSDGMIDYFDESFYWDVSLDWRYERELIAERGIEI